MRFVARESEIQKAILEYLTIRGIFAFRLNTSALKVEKRFIRAHSLGAGAADIVVFPRALQVPAPDSDGFPPRAKTGTLLWLHGAPAVWWLEVKRPGGKQSSEQQSFQKKVESEGQHYILVDSIDAVIDWLDTIGLRGGR